MTFLEEFLRVFPIKPGQALMALYWHVTRRRVRARAYIRRGVHNRSYFYRVWRDEVERAADVIATAGAQMESWARKPLVSIILNAQGQERSDLFERSFQSVLEQCYPNWQLLVVSSESAPLAVAGHPKIRTCSVLQADSLASALDAAHLMGEYVAFMRPGCLLSPTALFHFVEALQSVPAAAILYGDQDEIDSQDVRVRPWFKPKWNSELFLAQDYLSDACLIETSLARRSAVHADGGPGSGINGLLLLAVAERPGEIIHVPHVVTHVLEGSPSADPAQRIAAVAAHVGPASAIAGPGVFGTVKVSWPLPPDEPMVSIIIPTRDEVTLLQSCIESLERLTTYTNYEVIVVDNGSVEPVTLDYLVGLESRSRFKVIRHDKAYNFSEINNLAVRQADGLYLCLLNNDTEIVDGEWLSEMMRHAVRPEVGAVGAKLLYEDGSIQHAGVVIGIGQAAGHAHRFLRNGETGYFLRPHVAHFVSAVTAACLVVAKDKYLAVGGLDEAGFKVAFNDVDFCLKLGEAGWRNVYVPYAVLIHHESKSRGKDSSRQNIDRYLRELTLLQERWGTKEYVDPLHHPKLDRASETYMIKF